MLMRRRRRSAMAAMHPSRPPLLSGVDRIFLLAFLLLVASTLHADAQTTNKIQVPLGE